jgi:hypothetical protein
VRHFQRFWTWTTFVVHMSPSTSRLFFFDHCGQSLRTIRKNGSIREHQVTWWRCYNVSKTSCKLLDEDVTTYQEHVGSNLKNVLQRIMRIFNRYMTKKCQYQKDVLEKTLKHCYNVSGPYCKYLEEDATTYQERLANYLTKMLQRITNVLQDTWAICCTVSRTCLKLLDDDGTTHQEHLANYLTKMLQRIRNVWQITWKICYNVSRRSPKDTWKNITTYQKDVFEKPLQCFKNVFQVAWRRCYNVSKTSFKLLDEDVTTCQERLATKLEKLLQCIRNVFTVTWWRCYDVSIASCKFLDENVTTYQELVTKFLLRIKETYLKKLLPRVRNDWQVAWRRCYNVSRTPCKLLDEDVATYRERLASHLRKLSQCDRNVFKKMSQRIKNVVQFTWQKCYNVSTPSCVLPVIWKICYNISKGSSKDTWQKIFYVSKTRTWKTCFNISEKYC